MSLPPPPMPGVGGGGTYVGPYATSSVPLPPMRSLRSIWIALVSLFALVAVVDIGAASAFFHRASLLDDVADGGFPVYQELLDADHGVQRAALAHLGLAAIIAVLFIIWQFRHAKNAEALGERGGLGPAWAIGGWFVPLGNYVLPAIQIHQSSRLSDPAVANRPGTKGKGSGIVILWAVLLAVAVLVFVFGGGLRPTDENGNVTINGVTDVRDAASGDRTAGVAMVAFIAAAGAGGAMVRRLSTMQAVAYATRLAPGAGPAGSATTMGPLGGPPSPPGQWGAPPPPQWGTPPPQWSAPPSPPAPPREHPTQWGTPPP